MKTQTGPKILLVGTGSLLNYGCEAIVQGTYALTREYWPECELIVASDDVDYDTKLFAGYQHIRFVPYKRRYSPFRLLMGTLRRIGIGQGSPVRMNWRIMDRYDIFLSAGGDNFAQAPDGSLYHILLDLMKIGDRSKRLRKTYALWGASVGPFNNKNMKKVKNHLAKADVLFPREEISFNYLKSIGLNDKNHLVADPAFWMRPDDTELPIKNKSGELLIGLNLGPLAINHSFADFQSGTKSIFSALDSLLRNNPRYRFLCIPHVMTDLSGPQDDYSFMQSYIEFSEFKDRVDILKFGLGARKTKSIVSRCDLLIASRMHCCVAGISTGTPTLFLTYSQKGTGMANYAYGDFNMAFPLIDVSDISLCQKVEMIERSLQEYKDQLRSQQSRFQRDAAAGIIALKNLYESK